MTITTEFDRHPYSLRRAFNRLTGEQQQIVLRKFDRHAKACEKAGCDPDPRFLFEVIEDLRKGFEV